MLKIIISGKGGQGIKFISMLIAKLNIKIGNQVTLVSSYGPEARGGSSQCSIVIDDKPITNPVIKKSDILCAFTKEAVDTWGKNANEVIFIDNANNLFMLGKLLQYIDINIDDVIETMRHEISEKYKDRLESNIENLRMGYGDRTKL